jgi:hypothetical protein
MKQKAVRILFRGEPMAKSAKENGELVEVWPHDPRNGQPWRKPDREDSTPLELLRNDERHLRLWRDWLELRDMRTQLASDCRWGHGPGTFFRCSLPGLVAGSAPDAPEVVIRAGSEYEARARYRDLAGITSITSKTGESRDVTVVPCEYHDDATSDLGRFKEQMGMPLIG